jgi:hypothetical protein
MSLSSRNTPSIDNIGPAQTNDTILTKCLESIRTRRATIEDCVQQYPEFLELGSLLHAALDVYTLPKVEMTPSSKSLMRQRILAHYDAQPIRKPVRTPRFNWRVWLRPAIAFVTTLIVLFAGGSSLIQAASLAVPGDTLYGLKRATEQVQLSLATGESRSAALDQIANTRLNELTLLVSRSNSLSDSVLNDASASVSEALKAEPNAAKRATLLVKTTNVVQHAAKVGAINPATEVEILAAINKGHPDDGTDPIQSTVVPVKATASPTFTATFTLTPTATDTLTATPTVTPSPLPTDTPVAEDDTATPEPTKPWVAPVPPIQPPTPVPPTPPAGDPGNNGNNGNHNGSGNGNGGNGGGNGGHGGH